MSNVFELKLYLVTGTFNGSHIYAKCEGDARRAFRKKYKGESIIDLLDTSKKLTKKQLDQYI